MPNWVEKTGKKICFCLACGALVIQSGQVWLCTDQDCESHQHIHTEIVTVSSTASAFSAFVAEGTTTTTT